MKRIMFGGFALISILIAASAWLPGCGATDNGGGSGDTDTDTDGDSDADTTIYDVRQNNGVAVDQVVTLSGVIVTSPTLIDSEDSSGTVYVEEPEGGPWSGIILYFYGDVMLDVTLARGDVVDVTGQYQEFYGLSEIAVSAAADIAVTGTADVPAPAVVAPETVNTTGADAESYESVLIAVEDVTVTNPDMGYGQFQVTGDLLVADTFFVEAGGPSTGNITVADGDTFDAIQGILEFGYEEFKISPRDADDYIGFSGGVTYTEHTIYEIQQGEVAENSGVILTDVVVTSPLTFDDSGFFVEESAGGAYSGIYVHNYNAATDPVTIAVGDLVTVTGTYVEFEETGEMSEITIEASSQVEVTGAGTVPTPVAISDPATIATDGADAETYESVLVTVSDVAVTTEINAYGEFIVDSSLMIGSVFFDSFLDPALATTYTTVTGPLLYSYANSKLEPRTLADLVE